MFSNLFCLGWIHIILSNPICSRGTYICIHARQDRLLNISNCLMPGERYWGSHYTRLKEIKKVFRAHQCNA